MSIHLQIAALLIKTAAESDNAIKAMVSGKDEREVCHLIFSSYRGSSKSSTKGMRLSDVGLGLLKTFFHCHNVKLTPGYKLELTHILYLDRICKMPYWVDNDYIALFEGELALMLQLSDNDIGNLMATRFRLDPLTNDLKSKS